MASTPSDEDVSNFLAFTGSSDTQSAISYLEMANGNLEQAISLYMDHSAGGAASGIGSSMRGTHNSSNEGMTSIGSEDPDWLGTDAVAGGMIEGVRAPDATQRIRMVDDGVLHPMARMLGAGAGYPGTAGIHAFLGEDPNDAHVALSSIWGSTIASGVGDMDDSDDDNDAVAAAIAASRSTARIVDNSSFAIGAAAMSIPTFSGMSARDMTNAAAAAKQPPDTKSDDQKPAVAASAPAAPRLTDMFSPPSYRHRGGGFQGARNVAKDARRWLLVNIQTVDDFACHALNRDVWGDELVENLVQEGFILWQEYNTSQDGLTYVQRYNVQGFPHVGIIDPRTGRLMWKKEGWTQVNPLKAESFAEIAADFCSRHSFDKPPAAPKLTASTNGASGPAAKINKRPIHEMSEEEQLQAALKASMADEDRGFTDDMDEDSDQDQLSFEDDEDDNKKYDDYDSGGDGKKSAPSKRTMADELQDTQVGDEPPANQAGAVRILFRMPDGQRVVRRFPKDTSIKVIYAFVLQQLQDAQAGRPFQLRAGFPPKDLEDALNAEGTVEQEGLAGGQVMVSWKADP